MTTRNPVLLVFAHPSYEHSRSHRRLRESAGMPDGVTFHDLYETYPDFMINVRREQAMLADHAALVLQFPLFWYATPALLKEWFDVVWLHGFAYGRDGTRMLGKRFSVITTTGGEAGAYEPGGRNGYTAEEFLRPLERTAALCGMRWDPPMVIHADEIEHAAGPYLARLEALVADASARVAS